MPLDLTKMTEDEKDAHINAVEIMLDYGDSGLSDEDMELYNRLIAERRQNKDALEEVVVKSQAELDSISTDFSGRIFIEFGGQYNEAKLSKQYKGDVIARNGSWVEVTDCRIIARDNSHIVAFDGEVEALDDSVVIACCRSRVIAKDNSRVDAWDYSHVTAMDNSHVDAHIHSQVEIANEKDALDSVIADAEKRRDEQNEINTEQIDREAR